MKFDPTKPYKKTAGRLPEGTSVLQITEANRSQSKAGNEMVVITFTCVDEESEGSGCTIRDWFVLTPKAWWKFTNLIHALKKPGEWKGFDAYDQNAINEHLLGAVLVARVVHEADEYEDVRTGERRDGVKVQLDPDSFSTLTAGEKKRMKAQHGSAQGPRLEADIADMQGADIPF